MGPKSSNDEGSIYVSHEQDLQNKIEAEKAYIDKWASSHIPPEATASPVDLNPEFTPLDVTNRSQSPPTPPLTKELAPIAYNYNFDRSAEEEMMILAEASHEYANISLVLAFVSPLAGLILAFIAKKKAKEAGIKNETVKISILVNILFLILLFGFIVFIVTPSES
jgi:hypothetical protein